MKHFFVFALFVLMFAALHNPAVAQISMSRPLYEPSTRFVEKDFAWSAQKGTGVIAGRATLRSPGGYIQTADGEEVTLIAKNAYTDEIVLKTREEGFFDEYQNVKKDSKYDKYRITQMADKKGGFRFENLPAGDWYIVTRVIWYTRDQTSQVHLNGGLLWGEISIFKGQVRDDIELDSTIHMAK
ncbi:MAG: hypothetical protein COB59_10565 [Rhodospirillaceae bacterium]|nr:MAG: hypothetical protein COB59_10565 [Rhodospirillaceae bacterium]